jgi:ATP-dependent Clp protease ATP-binding subunit ClpA
MSQSIGRPFTSRAYVALAIGRGVAAARGETDVTGCHVAIGLLREGENPAVAALELAGVPVRSLRRAFEAALPEPGRPTFAEVVLPSTSGEWAIVQAAASEADTMADPYVGAEHLLLALLQDTGSPAARVFSHYGFTYDTAVGHLSAVRGGEVTDLVTALEQEYIRICPTDEPDTFLRMVTLDSRKVLKELRRLPDGSGQLAVLSAVKEASRGRHGPPHT